MSVMHPQSLFEAQRDSNDWISGIKENSRNSTQDGGPNVVVDGSAVVVGTPLSVGVAVVVGGVAAALGATVMRSSWDRLQPRHWGPAHPVTTLESCLSLASTTRLYSPASQPVSPTVPYLGSIQVMHLMSSTHVFSLPLKQIVIKVTRALFVGLSQVTHAVMSSTTTETFVGAANASVLVVGGGLVVVGRVVVVAADPGS